MRLKINFMKILNKKLFLILIIVILGIGISVFYWKFSKSSPQEPLQNIIPIATTTSSTTPNQSTSIPKTQTYINTEFGFEFQYPEKWVIVREDKSVNYYSKLLLEISAPEIFNNEKRFDSAFLVNIVLPEFIRGFDGLEKNTSEITVDSIKGVKYEYIFNDFPETTVILPFGELKIILGTGGGSKQYLDEFNQILASFKFLN